MSLYCRPGIVSLLLLFIMPLSARADERGEDSEKTEAVSTKEQEQVEEIMVTSQRSVSTPAQITISSEEIERIKPVSTDEALQLVPVEPDPLPIRSSNATVLVPPV